MYHVMITVKMMLKNRIQLKNILFKMSYHSMFSAKQHFENIYCQDDWS